MKQAVHDVELFMRAGGQETPRGPMMTQTAKLYFGNPDDLSIISPDGTILIGGLVGEEIAELAEAWMRGDDVSVLDGALSAIWTIIAGLRALGFPIVEGWQEVARSNHAAIEWASGMCLRREDEKSPQPEGCTSPDLRRVLDMHGLLAFASAAREVQRRADEKAPLKDYRDPVREPEVARSHASTSSR